MISLAGYFLLFSSVFFISCDNNETVEERQPLDQLTSDNSRSVRCSDFRGSPQRGRLGISRADDINSSNAGRYQFSGNCTESNETIEISVENKSLEKTCSGGRWSVALDVTSVVQGKETVNLSVSGSGSSVCVSVKNRFNCPDEYIPVPRESGYTSRDFCVMKYEASGEQNRNDRYGYGNREEDDRYGRGNYRRAEGDEYVYEKAVSRSGDDPWTKISYGEAREKCQNNGTGYDLITNDDWQTIAHQIESKDTNWSLGKSVVRADNFLNIGVAFIDAEGGSRRGGSSSQWELQKRTHTLLNGEEIWDFSGGVWEFVSDEVSVLGIQGGGNQPISRLSGHNKKLFGPKRNYTSFSTRNIRETPGGLGQAKLSSVKDYVVRGGGRSERDLGLYSVRADINKNRSGASLRDVGFRCVFRP